MFLYVPLLLILISLAGLSFIIFRKKDYLNKLYLLSGNDTDVSNRNFDLKSFASEFFPEANTIMERLQVNKHKALWLMEAEKLLRRTRLLFLKVDHASDVLIKKIRKRHVNVQIKNAAVISETPFVEPVKVQNAAFAPEPVKNETMSLAFLKNEEERLIIEIAKNPKDAVLYAQLGDIYMEMNNYSDAKESYEAAIELNSQDEASKKKLSSALAKLNPLN